LLHDCHITAYTLTCASGTGRDAVTESLQAGNSGLSAKPWPNSDVDTWLGRVSNNAIESFAIERVWESRNNRLAALGLAQDGFSDAVADAIQQFGSGRVGLILGTSTSSIDRTETAYLNLEGGHFTAEYLQPLIHTPHSTAAFVQSQLGIGGPAITVSTACSSSAKAFASGARWLENGLVDAVVIGGVDSICLSVIYGFHSLQLLSEDICKPFDENRSGINLGEAAGFALLQKQSALTRGYRLLGYGESTDAWHMSTPHPEGLGAKLAMQKALSMAGLKPAEVDYLNLHGTGTRANDNIEGLVCADLFPEHTTISATKGWTGHTLGAAGITEAIICLEALRNGFAPGTLNTEEPSTALERRLSRAIKTQALNTAMTNSFGFGGNNCSLIFGGQPQ